MKTTHALPILALAAFLASCGEKGEPVAVVPADPRVEAVLLAAEPAGAVSVVEARKKSEPGTEVIVVGRIGGTMQPFAKDYASLVLSDDALETCEKNPEDGCKTPWDACCVEPEVIAASRLSVQILGEDGQPVGQGLKGVVGLKELDTLVITGKVAEGSTPENLVLNATGIYRKGS